MPEGHNTSVLPNLPPVPPALPSLPPSLPPIPPPPGGTIEVMGQTIAVGGEPSPSIPPPGERPRRTRRTREQMEAARAEATSTTGAQVATRAVDVPEEPPANGAWIPPTAAPDASPGFVNAPSQVPQDLPRREDNVHPRTSPVITDPNAKPKFWTSVGATINIGNYESFKIDMGVSGIDYDADSTEIERIMGAAEVGIHETVEGLMNKVIDRAREIKIARGLPVSGDE